MKKNNNDDDCEWRSNGQNVKGEWIHRGLSREMPE